MICTPLDSDVATWIAPRQTPPRSVGHHVSTLIVGMLKEISRKYSTWGQGGEREPEYEVGYLWEDVMGAALASRVIVAPHEKLLPNTELHVGGIFGTPDRPLYDVVNRRFVVEETKATWKTARTVLGPDNQPLASLMVEPKFSYWLMQVKTYAAMLHRIPCLPFDWEWHFLEEGVCPPDFPAAPPVARIRALFLNGKYNFGANEFALPGCWQIEWTSDELNDWWANLAAFAARTEAPR